MSEMDTRRRRGGRRVGVFWALVVVLLLLLPAGTGLATPTPDYIIVNHSTKECTQSILGDDCMWCDPPPGWEVLGTVSVNQCPDGYTRVQRIEMQCKAYKNEFCCTAGSHGPGDCEDMVLHEADRLCTFVEDIQGCILPAGWTARPAADVYWACPHDYRWAGTLACQEPSPLDVPPTVEAPGGVDAPATVDAPGTTGAPDTPSEPEIRVSVPIVAALICLGAVFAGAAVAVLVLVVVLARRGRS